MEFLAEHELTAAIKKILQNCREPKIIVAYWGENALSLLGAIHKNQNAKIICCLEGGKSAPNVIKQFGIGEKGRARQIDNLHAKIYWTPDAAIVCSANASSNGLPEEEMLLSNKPLIEAGVLIKDRRVIQKIEKWFDDKYQNASIITDDHIKDAIAARQRRKNSHILPLEQFDLSESKKIQNIHVSWYLGDCGAYYNKRNCNAVINKDIPERRRIKDKNFEDYFEDELYFLNKDKIKLGDWLLAWECEKSGKPRKNGAVDWIYVHHVIDSGRNPPKSSKDIYHKIAAESKLLKRPNPPFVLTPIVKACIREQILQYEDIMPDGAVLDSDKPWSQNKADKSTLAFLRTVQLECNKRFRTR